MLYFRGGDKAWGVLVQVVAAAERVLHVQEDGRRRHHSGIIQEAKVKGTKATGEQLDLLLGCYILPSKVA